MGNVFIEARPKGRLAGGRIEDYVSRNPRGSRSRDLQDPARCNRMGQEERLQDPCCSRPAAKRQEEA